MAELDQANRFRVGGGILNNIQGPDIASAATIAPTHGIHRVTGTAAIGTITPPYAGFSGTVILVPTGAFTFTVSGAANGISTTGTAVVGRPLFLTFLPSTATWYQHAIA